MARGTRQRLLIIVVMLLPCLGALPANAQTPPSDVTESGLKIEVMGLKATCLENCRYDSYFKKFNYVETVATVRIVNLSEHDPKFVKPCNLRVVVPGASFESEGVDSWWTLKGGSGADLSTAKNYPPSDGSDRTRCPHVEGWFDPKAEIPVSKGGWMIVEVGDTIDDYTDSKSREYEFVYSGDESFSILVPVSVAKAA